jgi:hypothetical protein
MLDSITLLPQDIKSKILTYYLSYGSPTAKIIQSEIIKKCKNNSVTIWFANVDHIYNHRIYMLQKSIGCSFDVICDLRLAIIENNIENANTTDILKQIQKNVINNINTLTKYALERVLEEEEQLLIY